MWMHKSKYKGVSFFGNYELQRSGATEFHLRAGKKVVRFKSYQAAKKAGWVRA